MAAPLYQLDGLPRVRRMLRRAGGPELLDALKAAHARIAGTVTATGRPTTPYRTGRLAATVRPGATRTGAIVRAGGARVPYAGVIHYGWPARHIQPHPWLIDAAQSTESVWLAGYSADLAQVIERIASS